jgi:hypothetical protein
MLMKLIGVRRRFIKGYIPYGGSSWWTLSRECIEFIVDFITRNKRFVDYFKTTLCPDEIFFQTIVLNSIFRGRVVNNNYRYIDWSESRKKHTSNPNILTDRDYESIIASGKHFARKLDTEKDNRLFDMLDTYRLEKCMVTDSNETAL